MVIKSISYQFYPKFTEFLFFLPFLGRNFALFLILFSIFRYFDAQTFNKIREHLRKNHQISRTSGVGGGGNCPLPLWIRPCFSLSLHTRVNCICFQSAKRNTQWNAYMYLIVDLRKHANLRLHVYFFLLGSERERR